MEISCKGLIHYSCKSKKSPTRCKNKPKDNNGFCLKHKSQSLEQDRRLRMGICTTVSFRVRCLNDDTDSDENDDDVVYIENHITIVGRPTQYLGTALKAASDYFGVVKHVFKYNNIYLDLTSHMNLVDNMIIDLVPYIKSASTSVP